MFTLGDLSRASILSLLLGIFIGHRLALGRDKRKELYEAGKVFRDSFVETQRLLEINPPVNPAIGNDWQKTIKLVRKYYQQHHSAVVKFEQHLPSGKKASFRNCWDQYRCYDRQNNCETFADYECEQMSEELKKRHIAISRIKKLLDFTRV